MNEYKLEQAKEKKQVTIRWPVMLKEKLENYAKEVGIPMSDLVILIIQSRLPRRQVRPS